MSTARSQVFAAYRKLGRARYKLFKGDTVALQKSKLEVQKEFLKHGTVPIADAAHFNGLLDMADEAVDMLTHSIVRGNLNKNTGHYGTLVCWY